MPQVKRCVIILLVVIIIIATIITVFFLKLSSPQNIIENKLGFRLPANSKVLNYTHNEGGYFKAKISVDKQNINNFKKLLNNSLGGIAKKMYPERINFKNSCAWWELEEQDVAVSYNTFISGEKKWFGYSPKAHEVWVFVTKESNGKYYLYISY